MKKIALAVALSLISGVSSANLVSNGTFDTDTADWGLALADATVVGGRVELRAAPNEAGKIFQFIPTFAGLPDGPYSFHLQFSVTRDETGPGSGFEAFLVTGATRNSVYLADGTQSGGCLNSTSSGAFCENVDITGDFFGNFLGTTLEFEYAIDGNFWTLDNVVFEATPATTVPEPATGLLALAGLGMLGFNARRRSRKPD